MTDYPSPQSVGREFVRQYYTMLHEAPQFLHRFYSHDSSFLHGGVSDKIMEDHVAIGQSEIFHHIQALNFQNCHAKIRQVDSQMSINNSVVIQVVGELSNDSMPLRHFVQTFLLAPQSQKKFYVHNDIFRYQDDLDGNTLTETKVEDGTEGTHSLEGVVNGYDAGDFIEKTDHYKEEIQDYEVINKEVNMEQAASQETYATNNLNSQPTSAHHNQRKDPIDCSTQVKKEDSPNNKVSEKVVTAEEKKEEEKAVKEVKVGEKSEEKQIKSQEKPIKTPEKPITVASPQPPTWAAMASRNTGVVTVASAASFNHPNVGAAKSQTAARPETKNEDPETARVSSGQETAVPVEEEAQAGGQIFPDNQQVFVGNLPHNIQDSELREFFKAFGNIVDIRINRKTNSNLPNFGFVVFDCAEAVQKVLSKRPHFKGDHRINVEEKKPREELYSFNPRPRGGARGTPGNYGNRVFNNSVGRGGPRGKGRGPTPTSNRSSMDDGRSGLV